MKNWINRNNGLNLMIAGALAGLAIAFYMYLMPLTGVTATAGPLLAAFGCLALVVAGAILHRAHGGLRRVFVILSVPGLILTALAAWFLHGNLLLIAIVLSAIGFVIFLFNQGESHA